MSRFGEFRNYDRLNEGKDELDIYQEQTEEYEEEQQSSKKDKSNASSSKKDSQAGSTRRGVQKTSSSNDDLGGILNEEGMADCAAETLCNMVEIGAASFRKPIPGFSNKIRQSKEATKLLTIVLKRRGPQIVNDYLPEILLGAVLIKVGKECHKEYLEKGGPTTHIVQATPAEQLALQKEIDLRKQNAKDQIEQIQNIRKSTQLPRHSSWRSINNKENIDPLVITETPENPETNPRRYTKDDVYNPDIRKKKVRFLDDQSKLSASMDDDTESEGDVIIEDEFE